MVKLAFSSNRKIYIKNFKVERYNLSNLAFLHRFMVLSDILNKSMETVELLALLTVN